MWRVASPDKPKCPECGDSHVTLMDVGVVKGLTATHVWKCWNCGKVWQ